MPIRRCPPSVAVIAGSVLVIAGCATDDDPDADDPDAAPADPATDQEPGVDEPDTTAPDDPPSDDPDEGTDAPPVDDDPADPADPDDGTLPEGTTVATADDVDEPLVLAVGESVSLRLDQEPGYNVGTMDPSVVVVTPVDHFDDPGYAEWLIEPVDAGSTEVVATGTGVDELTFEVEVTG